VLQLSDAQLPQEEPLQFLSGCHLDRGGHPAVTQGLDEFKKVPMGEIRRRPIHAGVRGFRQDENPYWALL